MRVIDDFVQINYVRMLESLKHLKFFLNTRINFLPLQLFLVHLFDSILDVGNDVVALVDCSERATPQSSLNHIGVYVHHLPSTVFERLKLPDTNS